MHTPTVHTAYGTPRSSGLVQMQIHRYKLVVFSNTAICVMCARMRVIYCLFAQMKAACWTASDQCDLRMHYVLARSLILLPFPPISLARTHAKMHALFVDRKISYIEAIALNWPGPCICTCAISSHRIIFFETNASIRLSSIKFEVCMNSWECTYGASAL